MKSKHIENTLHSELVPMDHYCINCNRNKEHVNFHVSVLVYSKVVSYWCNSCYKKCAKRGNPIAKRVIEVSSRAEPVRYDLRHRFAIYFKEKYGDEK